MSDPLPADPYKALGVAKDADTDAVKKAYRKLVLTCHPDKTKALPESQRKEKEDQFHRVREAHELLSSPESRARYDLQVIRDNLLAEKRAHGPSRGSSSYAQQAPPRPMATKANTTPMYESHRGPPIYETRAPKNSYDEDRHESRSRAPPAHSYKEPYYDAAPPSTGRRSTGRATAGERLDRRERERDREDDERRAKKAKEAALKAEERRILDERQRKRDRDQRQARESKRYHARPTAESDSETDSETERFMAQPKRSPEPKKRYAEVRKPSRNEGRARTSRSEESDSEDPKERAARLHMQKHNVKVSSRDDRPSRPVLTRTNASRLKTPPPPAPEIETVKRPSSSRRGLTTSKSASAKDRKIDIVDPPRRTDSYDYDRDYEPASRSAHTSRASTFNDKVVSPGEKSPAPLRRSATTPAVPSSSSTHPPPQANTSSHNPARSSRLKHSESHREADYGSSDSDEVKPRPKPRVTKTSYRYVETPSDSDDLPNRPRVVEVSPDRERSRRDASPRTSSSRRFAPERTSSSTVLPHRTQPARAATLQATSATPISPRVGAHRTANHTPERGALFGEVAGGYEINYSPRIGADSVKYANPRRGSSDQVQDRRVKDAYSHIEAGRRGEMGGRGFPQESYA